MIRNAKDLSPDQKLAIESLLGRTLSADEQINLRTEAPSLDAGRGEVDKLPMDDIDSAIAATRPRRHISEVIRDNMRDLPPEVLAQLPSDGASEHDHYIYGLPKRHE